MPEQLMIQLRRSPRKLLERDGHPGPGPGNLALIFARAGVGKTAFLVGIGLVLGIAGSVGATRLLQQFLYETEPTDPVTFVGVSLFLGLVTLLACFLPAWRASRVSPVDALRAE